MKNMVFCQKGMIDICVPFMVEVNKDMPEERR
jgi:hypothetical protein